MAQTVVVVGATGNLGGRIARELLSQDGVVLHLLVRTLAPTDEGKARALRELSDRGAILVEADLAAPETLAAAVEGADVVISAVQGGREILVDGQIALAQAAKNAGVRRFIPSDFALDLWSAPVGAPMFALRREANAVIDELGLEVLHVLNGAFMDMMLDPRTAGVVDLENGVGNFYGDGTDQFDLTLIDDIARFTARLAIDEAATAGVYAISGSRTSFEQIITAVEEQTGRTFARNNRGSVAELRATVTEAQNPWSVMGQWYNFSMLTTPTFAKTANDRYPDARPTSLGDYLKRVLPTA